MNGEGAANRSVHCCQIPGRGTQWRPTSHLERHLTAIEYNFITIKSIIIWNPDGRRVLPAVRHPQLVRIGNAVTSNSSQSWWRLWGLWRFETCFNRIESNPKLLTSQIHKYSQGLQQDSFGFVGIRWDLLRLSTWNRFNRLEVNPKPLPSHFKPKSSMLFQNCSKIRLDSLGFVGIRWDSWDLWRFGTFKIGSRPIPSHYQAIFKPNAATNRSQLDSSINGHWTVPLER